MNQYYNDAPPQQYQQQPPQQGGQGTVNPIEGTVTAVRKDHKGFMLSDGNWYSGKAVLNPCPAKGQGVAFSFAFNGQYRNIASPITIKAPPPAAKVVAESKGKRAGDDYDLNVSKRQALQLAFELTKLVDVGPRENLQEVARAVVELAGILGSFTVPELAAQAIQMPQDHFPDQND